MVVAALRQRRIAVLDSIETETSPAIGAEVRMYFQSFYLSCLSHASYMIASNGEAAVVDPQRDVEIYLEEAKQQNLKIKYVIESHLHADFVSGHQELAARTGATICISEKAGAKFAHRAMRDGETLALGNCKLQ